MSGIGGACKLRTGLAIRVDAFSFEGDGAIPRVTPANAYYSRDHGLWMLDGGIWCERCGTGIEITAHYRDGVLLEIVVWGDHASGPRPGEAPRPNEFRCPNCAPGGDGDTVTARRSECDMTNGRSGSSPRLRSGLAWAAL